jgi:hypothetical protein
MAVRILKIGAIVLALAVVSIQAQQSPQERAASLRAQLADLQAQQTDRQARLAQIDEEIKPENIERSLAGIGSTHPEDLREARRRQLEIQRRGIQSQLDSLAASRTRLESAIASADAESYRQTVGTSATSPPGTASKGLKHSHRQNRRKRAGK